MKHPLLDNPSPDLSGIAPRGWIAAATSPHFFAPLLLGIGIANPGFWCLLIPVAVPVGGLIAAFAGQATPRQRLCALVGALPEESRSLPNIAAVVSQEWARRELRVGRERLFAYGCLIVSGVAFALLQPYSKYPSPATRLYYSIHGHWPAYLAFALCWLAVAVASLPMLRATMLESAALAAESEARPDHLPNFAREAAIPTVLFVLLAVCNQVWDLDLHRVPLEDAYGFAWVCLIVAAVVCVRGLFDLTGREQRAMAQLESLAKDELSRQRLVQPEGGG